MNRQLISSGSEFESKYAYSRALVQNPWVFVSGTTGYDYQNGTISDKIEEQAEQCFVNIGKALHEAGADFNDIVRVVYVVPDASEFDLCCDVLQKYLGECRPAAMMISAGLANEQMKIEIEVTALKSS